MLTNQPTKEQKTRTLLHNMADIYTRDNFCAFCKKIDAQYECRNCFEGPICRECVAEHTASGNWQGYFCLCVKPKHEMREIPICDGPYVDDEEVWVY